MKEELYRNIITLRLTDHQLEQLRDAADEKDVSMSDIVRDQLVVYLDSHSLPV